ncbi:MAG: hypothetical protein AAF533_29005 [Acidobacteriota bacterium]
MHAEHGEPRPAAPAASRERAAHVEAAWAGEPELRADEESLLAVDEAHAELLDEAKALNRRG